MDEEAPPQVLQIPEGATELPSGQTTALAHPDQAHPSRCHRRLIADVMLARGWRVLHLLPGGRLDEHSFTADAVVKGERVHYPPQPSLEV
ncbi:MAG TPA: hypothetical protein VFY04_05905 [Solirubrobacterales bacterium]|nr:hypothetical protein [Solirubrobacterales bacterium]